MDYLHACYTAAAKWGPGPSDTFTMRWYRAAPGAKEYPFEHAFGSTVDAGTFGSDTPPVGEIVPTFRQVSPMLPSLYDGSSEPFFMPQLLYGVDPAVMAFGCFDGSVEVAGSATCGFAGSVVGIGACGCSTASVIAGT